jgi:hypothetical protein
MPSRRQWGLCPIRPARRIWSSVVARSPLARRANPGKACIWAVSPYRITPVTFSENSTTTVLVLRLMVCAGSKVHGSTGI